MRCATALNLSYRCLNENKTGPGQGPGGTTFTANQVNSNGGTLIS
jgi:hypothetical protein